jgi:hypothetical protein
MDHDSILTGLILNSSLLLALGVLYEGSYLISNRFKKLIPYISGIIIGIFGICVMLVPFRLESGIVFDTRSILISVTAYIFGIIPTIIVVIFTSVYRIISGGAGVIPGIAVIFTSALIGVLWKSKGKRSIASKFGCFFSSTS